MKRGIYLTLIFLLSLLLYLFFYLAPAYKLVNCSVNGIEWYIGAVLLIFIISHHILFSKPVESKHFFRMFMLMMTSKFLLALVLLLVGLFLNRASAKCFVATFLCFYLVLLTFETVMILKEIKSRKK